MPTPALKLVDYPPTVILFVDGIVGAECGCIEIIDHSLVSMLRVITAEVLDECRNLTLELDVERFYDIKATVARLTGDNPVNVGVVVHADANRRVRVYVLVGTTMPPVESGIRRILRRTNGAAILSVLPARRPATITVVFAPISCIIRLVHK